MKEVTNLHLLTTELSSLKRNNIVSIALYEDKQCKNMLAHYEANYPMAFLLYALSLVPYTFTSPEVQEFKIWLREKIHKNSTSLSWNYYCKEYKGRELPNDLDDTVLCLLALYQSGVNLSTGYFLNLLDLENLDGTYRTWFASNTYQHFNDIDTYINAALFSLYSKLKIKAPKLRKYLLNELKTDLKSKYYISKWIFVLHLSRAVYFQDDIEIRKSLLKLTKELQCDSTFDLLLMRLCYSYLELDVDFWNLNLPSISPSVFCIDFPNENIQTFSTSEILNLTIKIEFEALQLDREVKRVKVNQEASKLFAIDIFSLVLAIWGIEKTSLINDLCFNTGLMFEEYSKYDNSIDTQAEYDQFTIKSRIILALSSRAFLTDYFDQQAVNRILKMYYRSLEVLEDPNTNDYSYIIERMSPFIETLYELMLQECHDEKSIMPVKIILNTMFLLLQFSDDIKDLHQDIAFNNRTYISERFKFHKRSKQHLLEHINQVASDMYVEMYKQVDVLKATKVDLIKLQALLNLIETFYTPFRTEIE
jgi:hypothetical protein